MSDRLCPGCTGNGKEVLLTECRSVGPCPSLAAPAAVNNEKPSPGPWEWWRDNITKVTRLCNAEGYAVLWPVPDGRGNTDINCPNEADRTLIASAPTLAAELDASRRELASERKLWAAEAQELAEAMRALAASQSEVAECHAALERWKPQLAAAARRAEELERERDEALDRLDSADADLAGWQTKSEHLEAAVRWALGESPEGFAQRPMDENGYTKGPYWWRSELRARAALSPAPGEGESCPVHPESKCVGLERKNGLCVFGCAIDNGHTPTSSKERG